MSGDCLTTVLQEIEKIADKPCTCTEAQQTGDDSSLCQSCEACHLLNDLGEQMRFGLGNLQK